ncbi:MAG: hypothetical protein KDA65_12025 [Planctomycetaceae bacterium]|nr:hypothetical protein [Planctomycetaceae bacterium]
MKRKKVIFLFLAVALLLLGVWCSLTPNPDLGVKIRQARIQNGRLIIKMEYYAEKNHLGYMVFDKVVRDVPFRYELKDNLPFPYSIPVVKSLTDKYGTHRTTKSKLRPEYKVEWKCEEGDHIRLNKGERKDIAMVYESPEAYAQKKTPVWTIYLIAE